MIVERCTACGCMFPDDEDLQCCDCEYCAEEYVAEVFQWPAVSPRRAFALQPGGKGGLPFLAGLFK